MKISSAGLRRSHGGRGTRSGVSPAGARDPEGDLCRLGDALAGRLETLLDGLAAHPAVDSYSREGELEHALRRLARIQTLALGRCLQGDGSEIARQAASDSAGLFGELACERAAPLDRITSFWLGWRDVISETLGECAAGSQLAPQALARARRILQSRCDAILVSMCESFESERRRADEKLTFLATHDVLTGLPNRSLIAQRMQQLIQSSRHHHGTVAIVFVDLDDFKIVNDTLGHGAGDELLKQVTSRLLAVVPDPDALGRLGGDEFVVVIDERSCLGAPQLIAQCMLESLREPFTLAGGRARMSVTASIGVASSNDASAEELLREADIAMYRAKWQGKNRYSLFPFTAEPGQDPGVARATATHAV